MKRAFLALACAAPACAAGGADPAAVLEDLTAAALAAARPLGHKTAGAVTWSKVESASVGGQTVPLLKVKLAEPLETSIGVVKMLATDPRTSFAAGTLGLNMTDEEVAIKDAKGGARTLRMATLSLEIPLGAKDPAADRRRAQGFALVRRALTSEAAKWKAGEALYAREVALAPDGSCRIEGRAATPAALVAGLEKLAGETVAGPKPSPVVLGDVKIAKLARETVDGVEGITFGVEAKLVDAKPGAKPQGFAALALGLELEPALVALHAPMGDATLGRVERLQFESAAVSFRTRTALMRVADVVKKLEENPGVDPSAMLVSFSHETKVATFANEKGVTQRYIRALASFGVAVGAPAATGPRRGDVTRAVELLSRTYANHPGEFVPMDSAPPPPAGAMPPPPVATPPGGWRPSLRDFRVLGSGCEIVALYTTPAMLKDTMDALGKAGFTELTKAKEVESPWRDRKVLEVVLKGRIGVSK